jgi:hypothetical protein
MDEEGRLNKRDPNPEANKQYEYGNVPGYGLVGPVLLIKDEEFT